MTPESFHQQAYAGEAAKNRSKALRALNEAVRALFVVGFGVAGVGAAELPKEKGQPAMSIEQKLQQQAGYLRQFKEKEQWLQTEFGPYIRPQAERMRRELAGMEADLAAGKKVEPREVVDVYSGPAETEKTEGPTVSDIEGQDGVLSAEDLRQILNQTYPKGFINNQIASIEQKRNLSEAEKRQLAEKDERDKARYGLNRKAGANLVGRAEFVWDNTVNRGRVLLYPATSKDSVRAIIEDDIVHEALGHGNDWDTDHDIVLEQGLDLLHDVAGRLSAVDRFQSPYVEGINIPADAQEEGYSRAKEYYAEIMAQYFRDADQLAQADFEIVDRQVRNSDPKFDWKQARQRRDQLIEQALKTQSHAP